VGNGIKTLTLVESTETQKLSFVYKLEADRYHFVETNIDNIFKKIFIDIWPVADIRLATNTNISKFAFRYNCQYFNKAFWLKLVYITYNPDLATYGSLTNEVD